MKWEVMQYPMDNNPVTDMPTGWEPFSVTPIGDKSSWSPKSEYLYIIWLRKLIKE